MTTARLACICALILLQGLSAAVAGPIFSSQQRLDNDIDLPAVLENQPDEGTNPPNDPPDDSRTVFSNPEPSSLALLAVGGLGLAGMARRRKAAKQS